MGAHVGGIGAVPGAAVGGVGGRIAGSIVGSNIGREFGYDAYDVVNGPWQEWRLSYGGLRDQLFSFPAVPPEAAAAVFASLVNRCPACGLFPRGLSYALLARACTETDVPVVEALVNKQQWDEIVNRDLCAARGDTWEWYALSCPANGSIVILEIHFPLDLHSSAGLLSTEMLRDDSALALQHAVSGRWLAI